jgi:hypothetical protein
MPEELSRGWIGLEHREAKNLLALSWIRHNAPSARV